MTYRFRLTFFHSSSGFFRFDEQSISLEIEEGHEYQLTARDSDKLIGATKFHIDGYSFKDEESARSSGERLRVRLRVLNAMLGLGISVPTIDSTSGSVSSAIKKDVFEKTGGIALDTIVGLAVFPDDERHFEYVMSGNAEVYPSKPDYVLTAIKKIWPIDMSLDDRAEDALNIVNISTTESSPRAKFLTTFLALERLIDRNSRSDPSKNLLAEFQKRVKESDLKETEKESLYGSLAALREESLSSALTRFAASVNEPKEIGGQPTREFFSTCIYARNKIAHNATLPTTIDLNAISNELRKVVLSLIWSRNGIPNVSIEVPASAISIPEGGFSIRVL